MKRAPTVRVSERVLRIAGRLRLDAVEQARQGLSQAIATAASAAEIEHLASAAISREAEAATSLAADDAAVEAFAAWLPRGRAAVTDAVHRRDAAEAAVSVARATLAAARAAQEATETLLARQQDGRRLRRRHGEQAAIDEAAARPVDMALKGPKDVG